MLAVFVAWLVALVIGRVPLPLHRFIAAWVRYATHVDGLPLPHRRPVPGLRRRGRQLPRRPRDRSARAAAAAGDALPRPPRDPRSAARRRVLGGALDRRRCSAGGRPSSRGGCRRACATSARSALRYSGQANAYLFLLTDRYPYSAPAVRDRERDEQLVLPFDEPAARADADRNRAGLNRTVRRHRLRLSRSPSGSCAPRCSSARRSRPACTSPAVDADAVFGKALVRQAVHVERFFLFTWVLGQIALFATLWIYARRGPRFARESAAGPIGTGMLLGMLGLGHRLARPAAVHAARRLVGATVRPDRGGLPRVGARPLVRARRRVRLALHRAPRRDVPRALARRDLVDPRARSSFVAIGAGFAFAQPYLGGDDAARRTRR